MPFRLLIRKSFFSIGFTFLMKYLSLFSNILTFPRLATFPHQFVCQAMPGLLLIVRYSVYSFFYAKFWTLSSICNVTQNRNIFCWKQIILFKKHALYNTFKLWQLPVFWLTNNDHWNSPPLIVIKINYKEGGHFILG